MKPKQPTNQHNTVVKIQISHTIKNKRSPHDEVTSIVSEFGLQLRYYVHFQTNAFEKGINRLIPSVVC